jgi:glycosyltransferase involved in cell wall biosynthesis
MSANHLHIISFDVPYPPDYGGVIDVFYKMKALAEKGFRIHLHTFYRNRSQSNELLKYCESVNYYKQKNLLQSLSFKWPAMMYSRRSASLLNNLSKDDYPILFEGFQSARYLCNPHLKGRLKLLRMHNVEWEYYRHLGMTGKNKLKKIHWLLESKKIRKTEHILSCADYIFSISIADREYFEKAGFEHVVYLPVFHQNQSVQSKNGKGDYLLYHGNLSVQENLDAVNFLAEQVIPFIPFEVKIAGKNPPNNLVSKYNHLENLNWVINPPENEMNLLIQKAHINLLPTFQDTGIKLKLINALFNGRFCMVTPKMVNNTGLENLCYVAEDGKSFISGINKLMQLEFTKKDIDERKSALMKDFSNNRNICLLETLLKG